MGGAEAVSPLHVEAAAKPVVEHRPHGVQLRQGAKKLGKFLASGD